MEQLAVWTNITDTERELLHHLARDMASDSPPDLPPLCRIDLETADEEVLGLMPYVHGAYPEDAIAEPVRRIMRGLHDSFAARNEALLTEALSFIGRCNAADIPIMLCTNEALRLHYLKDFPKRIHDVDLLTSGSCFKRARTLAAGVGFAWKKDVHSVSLWPKRDPAMQIDLHHVLYKHHCVGAAREREESIWERSSEIHVQGAKVFLPALEDIIVHLVTSALGNMLSNCDRKHLKWMLDAFCLMNRYDVDWEKTRRIAREQGIALHYSLGLQLLDHLFPGMPDRRALEGAIPIPATTQERIHRYVHWKNRAGPLKLREKWYAHTLHRESGFAANLASFPRYMLTRCALDRFSFIPGDFFQKLRTLRRRMTSSPD